jgi:hypothetical protein
MLARFRSSLWPSGSISIGASRARQPLPDNFVHAEWITLHDNPDFRGFVDFLRTELDRVGPAQACAATSSVGLSPSNSPSSKPPTPSGPDTVLPCSDAIITYHAREIWRRLELALRSAELARDELAAAR